MKLTRQTVKKFLPKRPKQSSKGSFGRVLIIAGSEMMTGAAVLCARSTLKAGGGLVTLALPKSRQCVAAASLSEMITLPLPEQKGVISLRAVGVLYKFIKEMNPSLVVIGPGLADAKFVIPFLKRLKLPVIVDADGLNQLATQKDWAGLFQQISICTPHPGEMQRLLKKPICTDEKTRIAYAKELCARTRGVCILKGRRSVITDGKTVYSNTTGGAELAKAGTGDVLCGLTAGFWAQLGMADGFNKQTALRAVALAAYVHGLCGELAAKKMTGYSVLAGELLDFLPAALRSVQK